MKNKTSELFCDARKQSGVSQQEVARVMGLSLTAYRNKEKGRSRFFADEIPSFCKATGINIQEMLNQIFFDLNVSD